MSSRKQSKRAKFYSFIRLKRECRKLFGKELISPRLQAMQAMSLKHHIK
jgi:hypothetical protein